MFDNRWLTKDYGQMREPQARATRKTHPRWPGSDPRRERADSRRAG